MEGEADEDDDAAMRRLQPRDGAPLHSEQARGRALEVRYCRMRKDAGGGDTKLMLDKFVRRGDGRIEQMCKHGIGHPLNGVVWKGEWQEWMGIHGCDGCSAEGQNELAYWAGIVDGEGCVSLAQKKKSSGLSMSPRIDVGNTYKLLMDKLADFLKKRYGCASLNRQFYTVGPRRKTIYRVTISGEKAINFLEDLQPYLIVKRNQTSTVIDFARNAPRFNRRGFTPEEKKIRLSYVKRLRALNKKGRK